MALYVGINRMALYVGINRITHYCRGWMYVEAELHIIYIGLKSGTTFNNS